MAIQTIFVSAEKMLTSAPVAVVTDSKFSFLYDIIATARTESESPFYF